MGRYAELMQRMHVRVSSPDGNIVGVMDGTSGGSLAFEEGSYRTYTERSLERQLAALGKLMVVGRRRAQREALQTATGFAAAADDPAESDDPKHRRYLERWAQLTCEAMSPGECVYLSATGMRDWTVVIKDGTLRRLDETELLAEVHGAVMRLLDDQRDKENALFHEIYQPQKGAR